MCGGGELLGSLNIFKEVLNRLRMYGNGYSMAIVLDHRSTRTSLTGNRQFTLYECQSYIYKIESTTNRPNVCMFDAHLLPG